MATLITLLTDFGTADSYVGEVKGVLLSQVHGVVLADFFHQVPPGDVRAAQYILSRVWQRFPQGTVHLAVMAPGLGTDRRALAASLTPLGHPISDPYRAPLPSPHQDGAACVVEVLYVDRFGTLISNIPGDAVEPGVRIR